MVMGCGGIGEMLHQKFFIILYEIIHTHTKEERSTFFFIDTPSGFVMKLSTVNYE